MKPVTITRRKKYEAIQAIKDLEARGYVVVYPLTERRSSMEQRGTYNHTKAGIHPNTLQNQAAGLQS